MSVVIAAECRGTITIETEMNDVTVFGSDIGVSAVLVG